MKRLRRAARARGIPTWGVWWRRFKRFHQDRVRGRLPSVRLPAGPL